MNTNPGGVPTQNSHSEELRYGPELKQKSFETESWSTGYRHLLLVLLLLLL